MANVRVAHLPQSKISSLIRRPIVPTISSTKAIKRVYSRIDVPPHMYYRNQYIIEDLRANKNEPLFAGGGECRFYSEGITIDTMLPL